MKRRKIVAGNWKMNTRLHEAVELAKAISVNAPKNDVVKIIAPPFPFIKTLRELLAHDSSIHVAAQNCSEHEKGAYTGEVGALMLRDSGCRYVIVGHSERRSYFRETDQQLQQKITQVLQNEMSVIFCFGEQLAERRAGRQNQVVKEQLAAVLRSYPPDKLDRLILAYEPVWAIGTGETATPRQAQEMHAHVRSVVEELFGAQASEEISILYGGSCNAQNARELFACPDVDGGLIGGASLKAADFCTIISSF